MSTGLETWNQNLLEVGPLYPFVGSEGALALVGIGLWLCWHIVQTRSERRQVAREQDALAKPGAVERSLKED